MNVCKGKENSGY